MPRSPWSERGTLATLRAGRSADPRRSRAKGGEKVWASSLIAYAPTPRGGPARGCSVPCSSKPRARRARERPKCPILPPACRPISATPRGDRGRVIRRVAPPFPVMRPTPREQRRAARSSPGSGSMRAEYSRTGAGCHPARIRCQEARQRTGRSRSLPPRGPGGARGA